MITRYASLCYIITYLFIQYSTNELSRFWMPHFLTIPNRVTFNHITGERAESKNFGAVRQSFDH
jgi:hypothetical protein